MLPAFAARTVGVDFDVFVFYIHIDVVFYFRDYVHRCERSVAALIGVEWADSDKPVHASFGLAVAVGVGADYAECHS